MGTTLVKNGTVVTASDRYQADIYIDKGVITLIGQGLNLPADEVIDASGMSPPISGGSDTLAPEEAGHKDETDQVEGDGTYEGRGRLTPGCGAA